MHDVKDVFDLLHYNDLELTLDFLVENRKQSALEEAEELALEPKERIMMALKLRAWTH
jgi:hypothetical protein